MSGGMGNGAVKSPSSSDEYEQPSHIERQKQISVRGIAQVEDVAEIKNGFNRHLHFTMIKDRNVATNHDYYLALAHCVRDHIVSRWIRTQQYNQQRDPKYVYFISMEYNMGRFLQNMMINIGIEEACDEATYQLGLDIEELQTMEGELHLDNGGMGRYSACLLDATATLGIPTYGYGIRYNCGAFSQRIYNGEQHEEVDDWLRYGNPWEKACPEYIFLIQFYGKVTNTDLGRQWVDYQVIHAFPYDYPIPGYKNNVINTLRLWSAKSAEGFNLQFFNNGDYIQAIFDHCLAENLTRVMYPTNGNTIDIIENRLKQEYFLCSASLQDILRRFRQTKSVQLDDGRVDFFQFPFKAVIQLNNTYSAWIIPELLRIFLDVENMSWDMAWTITKKSCAFTSHNIFAQTTENWPISLIEKVLPRHMEILYQINFFHLESLKEAFVMNLDRAYGLSCISKEHFDMAAVAVLGSFAINGVSKFHSNYLRTEIFSKFYELEPEKYLNITNGITQRRWLFLCNPSLSNVITEKIGDKWPVQADKLESLKKLCRDNHFMRAITKAKQENKMKLVEMIEKKYGLNIDSLSLFDMQVHHIAEHKRQLLSCLYLITMLNRIKYDSSYTVRQPRTMFVGGKAEPGDRIGKKILKLTASIADAINKDPQLDAYLKVVVLENYSVSLAEEIIPAADLSQHLSLPGTEASGTSHIKFMMNGALLLVSFDGGRHEVINEIGKENIFTFGMTLEQIEKFVEKGYYPMDIYRTNASVKQCLDQIRGGFFSPENVNEFNDLVEFLLAEDKYFVLADYNDYVKAQDLVAETFQDKKKWNEMTIRNIAASGHFSIDRTVKEYAKIIWDVEPNLEAYPEPSESPFK